MGIKFLLMVNKQGQTRLAKCVMIVSRVSLRPEAPGGAPAAPPSLRAAAAPTRASAPLPPCLPLRSYYDWHSIEERSALEAEIIRKCLSRTEHQCSFMDYRGMRVVYRRYASLFFIVGTDPEEDNELGMLEFIHALVETLDKYFENVCELDIMFNLEKAQFILGERARRRRRRDDGSGQR